MAIDEKTENPVAGSLLTYEGVQMWLQGWGFGGIECSRKEGLGARQTRGTQEGGVAEEVEKARMLRGRKLKLKSYRRIHINEHKLLELCRYQQIRDADVIAGKEVAVSQPVLLQRLQVMPKVLPMPTGYHTSIAKSVFSRHGIQTHKAN
jgi:hypothetical protein